MKILKFGGTSVGTPERMHSVASLITADPGPKIVVLSALSGSTNALVEIGELLLQKNKKDAFNKIEELYHHYTGFNTSLFRQAEFRERGKKVIDSYFSQMKGMLNVFFNKRLNNELLAMGELLSTNLFFHYLQERKIEAVLLSALDFMYIDKDKEPDIDYIREHLLPMLDEKKDANLFITQGYICRNDEGEIENLKRGGSDYTSTLLGAALESEEVQIWTDIDGMHNNDPRVVDKTYPISLLSFNEANELAYFGAKILHPASIWPAQKYNIPVRLKNTMNPAAEGTIISEAEENLKVKAVAAKSGITAIKIRSSRMLLAYGFLRKIFEVFEKYKTPIDMISTSEVAVSLTIDDKTYLKEIVKELGPFGEIFVDEDQTIICLAGNMIMNQRDLLPRIFEALQGIPVRMISYGGSMYNVSVLIEAKHKKTALQRLNKYIFELGG
ncbi:MAG TPA: aspartate kinase [Cyclobacteriaceae bacterium]|nr:aspartate kinase [Cyclobacteriaceae bacterium]